MLKTMIPKKPANPDALRLKMADLCARSEQCEFEIREKLRRKALSTNEINKIIEFLVERKFIDNERYARSFTNDKVRFAGWGRNKIRQALAMKRIPEQYVTDALKQIDTDEYNNSLFRAASAKARYLNLTVNDDRAKLYRHLLSRGYESSFSLQAISALRKLSQQ